MIPGIELWPDQEDDQPLAQGDLDALAAATAGLGTCVLKARWFAPRHLAQLAEVVPGALLATRPRAEGRSVQEIVGGIAAARAGVHGAGLQGRWLVHEAQNEPNHPEGPWAGADGAWACARVLLDALLATELSGVPLGSPGLVPMNRSMTWAAVLSGLYAWPWRCGHVYGQRLAAEGDDGPSLDRAIGDAMIQVGGLTPAERMIMSEIGDATALPERTMDQRASWVAAAMHGLAQRGVHAGVIFVLRAPGWDRYELGAERVNRVLRAMTSAVPPPEPTTGGTIMPTFRFGFADYAATHAAMTPLEDERPDGEGNSYQRFARGDTVGLLRWDKRRNLVEEFVQVGPKG